MIRFEVWMQGLFVSVIFIYESEFGWSELEFGQKFVYTNFLLYEFSIG